VLVGRQLHERVTRVVLGRHETDVGVGLQRRRGPVQRRPTLLDGVLVVLLRLLLGGVGTLDAAGWPLQHRPMR